MIQSKQSCNEGNLLLTTPVLFDVIQSERIQTHGKINLEDKEKPCGVQFWDQQMFLIETDMKNVTAAYFFVSSR